MWGVIADKREHDTVAVPLGILSVIDIHHHDKINKSKAAARVML
jgi:hypothetical protein